ncbi:MAG TPA: hypothetical protein VGP36_25735 [Mycobacteriales bacterium]|nr:hypothetical protein [Mycobacteriales bacterium]
MNDTYGDPFIREQVDNTVDKLLALRDHRAPIAIFTKAGYDVDVLARLAAVTHHPRVIVFYSLTGLDEGGIDFPERLRMIAALRELFPNTFVFTRPIIRRRNDDPATLTKLAQAAADLTGQLVLGGLHDAKKRKQLDLSVEHFLIEACERLGVRTFFKTACAGAWTSGRPCWVHDLGEPHDLDTLTGVGYRATVDGLLVRLPEGTTGDINFVRMVSGADVYVERLLSNYNLLTMPTGRRKLEATSSWFAWSENIDTCLDCNYCIIKQIEYLKKMRVRIGVHPTRIPEIVTANEVSDQIATMRRTKLPTDAEQCHQYGDVRAQKPCRIGLYARPEAAAESASRADPKGGEPG